MQPKPSKALVTAALRAPPPLISSSIRGQTESANAQLLELGRVLISFGILAFAIGSARSAAKQPRAEPRAYQPRASTR